MSTLRTLRSAAAVVVSAALTLTAATAGPASAVAAQHNLPTARVYTADLHSVRLLAADGKTAKAFRLPHGGRQPLISSDGRRIAYVTDVGIRVMSPNGAHDHYMVKGENLRMFGWRSDLNVVFSGTHFPLSEVEYAGGQGVVSSLEKTIDPTIVSVAFTNDGRMLISNLHGWKLVSAKGASPFRLAKAPCLGPENLAWAEDELHLAFTCDRGGYSVVEVYDVLANTFSVLPRRDLARPQWLANGTLVAAHFGPSGFSKQLTGWSAAGKHLWNQPVSNSLLSLVVTEYA